MYLATDGELVVSPTDLTNFLACRHLTQLDLAMARGLLASPAEDDGALAVLRARGLEHERAYLRRLRVEGQTVTEIRPTGDLRQAETATLAAMRAGVDVVYQATFFDGRWRGHADFLERRDGVPSDLGPWSYDLADTKLARHLSVAALLQMAVYAERLATLQGRPPEFLTVVTGDGDRRPYRFADCAAYARRVQRGLLAALEGTPSTYPEKIRHCSRCRWESRCSTRRRADDHLSVVAGMRPDQARRLALVGVRTVADLASAEPAALPDALHPSSRQRLVRQAGLQIAARQLGRPPYELLPPEAGRGLAKLPEPSSGDLFLDLEGDPYIGDGGLEYLFGLCDGEGRFTAYWARSRADERHAFEQVVDHVMRAWAVDPGMHVFHYAAYEVVALRRLSARYNTRVDEVDRLLRGGRLVDLYAVVRQGLRAGTDSYSLKKLEALYDPGSRTGDDVTDAVASIVAFERWLSSGDEAELIAIERYNEADCRSTLRLRAWLEQRRTDLVESGAVVPRPIGGDGEPSGDMVAVTTASQRLYAELTAGLPVADGRPNAESRATRLLADLLDWHRREVRPEWWEYFQRLELTDDGLVDDAAAVGDLTVGDAEDEGGRSVQWRMRFPPQETKLRAGESRYVDPATGRRQGTVTAIDAEQGWLRLRRPAGSGPPTCRSLIPAGPLDVAVLRTALRRLGEWTRDHGIANTDVPHRAARDLLLRRPPRGEAPGPLVGPDEAAADAVVRLALRLSGGYLAVQGPPGAGKTWAAARAVVSLVASGRRVGLCAFSHQAVANLLHAVVTAAARAGVPLRALQKAGGDDRCRAPGVTHTGDGRAVAASIEDGVVEVVAGSSWLFSREDLAGTLDTLVVDEAGQLSLANVLAVAGSATNLLLLGDPQQLAQPAHGDHPPGAGVSALEHVLGGAATVPAELGVFLDRSWRMHPEICSFVSKIAYDGRLTAHEFCGRQKVIAPGALTGSGLRWAPLEHLGNRSASAEEADLVARFYADLRLGSWVDAAGLHRPITANDVLVVAPYNAHVGRLRSVLPADARVGTVDRFQGQEAAVVLYSTAASSPADATRGGDFLYSLNRLNVAISRARALVAVVASPRLLDAAVHSPSQLQAVNALCRFVELAQPVAASVSGTAPNAGVGRHN